MYEIEIKAYCENHDELIEKIENLGGKFTIRKTEVDVYMNHPSRNFGETDEALRIRRVNDDVILTYKGPKISKASKARVEKEVTVSDFNDMKSILDNLGFIETGHVEKDRIYYVVDDIEICVDKVKGLGNFVELEKIGADLEKTESILFQLAGKLGLNKFERKSYLELILEKGN